MSGRVSLERRGSAGLAARRRRGRRRAFIAFVVVLIILCGAALYGVQQPAVRISHVEVFGTNAALATIAEASMRGRYLGIIPRDSTFFFPEATIRADILAARLDLSTISIFRNGLTGLSIKVNNRVPIARWRGAAKVASSTETCYVFDDSGYIFATTSDESPVNPFTFYEPLNSGSTSSPQTSSGPIGSTLPHVSEFPAAFNFARQVATLGSPVSALAIHDGEVDVHLTSGTRLTYVLGHEQNAFTALVSAKSNFNLADGSLDYVDLRFDGKVYVKKKGAGSTGSP